MPGRTKALLAILAVVLVVALVDLRGLARRLFREVTQRTEDTTVRTRLTEAALQSSSEPKQTATLYFPAYDTGTLVAETRPITWAQLETDRIRQVLLGLIEGSHQAHSPALPPNTTIRGVFLTQEGTAYVDFSQEMSAGVLPGIASENLVAYSIANSLAANVPAVKRVKILIQGQEADTLNGHEDLSEPLAPGWGQAAPPP